MKMIWIALAMASAFVGGAVAQQKNPDFRYLKPEGLFINPRYSHVIEVNKGKLIFIAGQMPVDKEGRLVGKGDFRAQAKQAYDNLMLALKAAGLDASSVVKLNMYVVDLPANNPANREVRSAYFPDTKPNPTATAVGVTALALEGQMIEVEAVAIGKQ